MTNPEKSDENEAAMEAAQERSGEPHLRDILKREANEARPCNEALVKWGPSISERLMQDLKLRRFSPGPLKIPRVKGPEMDR